MQDGNFSLILEDLFGRISERVDENKKVSFNIIYLNITLIVKPIKRQLTLKQKTVK